MIPLNKDPKAIHETVIRDIVELIADGVKKHNDYDDFITIGKNKRARSFRSITKASSNLILTFPLLISDQADLESSTMIMKSHERKCAALMQMLFSALCVSSDDENVYEYLRKFHKNIDFDQDDMNVDNFVDSMDAVADHVDESYEIPDTESRFFKEWAYGLIQEDMKNLNYYKNFDVNSSIGINEYKVMGMRGSNGEATIMIPRAINEGGQRPSIRNYRRIDQHGQEYYDIQSYERDTAVYNNNQQAITNRTISQLSDRINTLSTKDAQSQKDLRYAERKSEALKRQAQAQARKADRLQRELDKQGQLGGRRMTDEPHWTVQYKNRMDAMKAAQDIAANPFVKTDVPKANELLPTMMVIHFHSYASNEPITAVIGIKAKLYPMPSQEIINRLIIRNKDNQGFHNFLRAATREISFLKDFVFAVDKAKIDALSSSKKGSDSKIWKLLEKRAIRSKIKRSLGSTNDATAITTLVVTQEEVELLKKEYKVDINRIPVIRPIMDAYNLMGVVIIDQNVESVRFLYDDGSNKYETYSYRSLERETGDQNYKKVINLMTKMVRQ